MPVPRRFTNIPLTHRWMRLAKRAQRRRPKMNFPSKSSASGNALDEAQTPGTRKVAMRITMVFGRDGGVFPVFRRLAQFGLGGEMGNGKQYFSWIHEEDFLRAVEWIIASNEFERLVNVAAPNPLPNREMMRLCAQACRRAVWSAGDKMDARSRRIFYPDRNGTDYQEPACRAGTVAGIRI